MFKGSGLKNGLLWMLSGRFGEAFLDRLRRCRNQQKPSESFTGKAGLLRAMGGALLLDIRRIASPASETECAQIRMTIVDPHRAAE